jgi:hypothetical protein
VLAPSLRTLLENGLHRLADEGHMAAQGEREVRLRIDTDGHIRWFEAWRVRTPASELDADAS